MATSLITQPANSLSLKRQEEEISPKDTFFFSALASCKGDIFQEVLVWSYWNLFLGVSLVLQELCPGQGCIRHKVKKERRKERESLERQPAGGFPTQMCSSHVLWSQTGRGWSEGLTEPCQAQTQSSILKGSAAKWEGTTSFLILSPLLKLSSCSEGGSTAGEGGGGLSSWY